MRLCAYYNLKQLHFPDNNKLQVLSIIPGTSVDGVGLRTSIYFAGCSHHCPGCHNPESWKAEGGAAMTVEEILQRVIEEDFNVTFSGGDPIYQLSALIPLAEAIKKAGYNIWLYTGYTFDELLDIKDFHRLLPYIDTIVDGPYIESLRDTSLKFRGSANQRIIHLKDML